MAILQDADEFLADPGNQEQVSKRLNFNTKLKDLELQGLKEKLTKVVEETGNLKVSNEGLKGTSRCCKITTRSSPPQMSTFKRRSLKARK